MISIWSFETPAPSGDFSKGFKAHKKKEKQKEKVETEKLNKTAITSKVNKIQQF